MRLQASAAPRTSDVPSRKCRAAFCTRHCLYATLRGQRAGSTVTFGKTYDRTGGWEHSVDYEGSVSEDGTEVAGEWRVQGWSGPFLMMRANGKEDAVLRKALQPVSVS